MSPPNDTAPVIKLPVSATATPVPVERVLLEKTITRVEAIGRDVDRMDRNVKANTDAVKANTAALAKVETGVQQALTAAHRAEKAADLTSQKVDQVEGVLLRVETKLDRVESKLGTYPMSADLVLAMERESVRELTPEAIVERDKRLAAARFGTGVIGDIKTTKAQLEANDAKLEAKDAEFERRLSEMVKTEATQAARGVVTEAKEAATTSTKSTLIKGGIGAGVGGILIAVIMALGGSEGITEGAVRIIHAVQRRDVPVQTRPGRASTTPEPRD